MAKKQAVSVSQRSIDTVDITLIGTAPMLVGHPLPWDVMSWWDDQPAEVTSGNRKLKLASEGDQRLLLQIGKNGYSLPMKPYNAVEGVNAYQEAILRGHWLPDLAPGFPVSGFLGALTSGSVQYGGKNYGLSATKLRSLTLLGDSKNTALARIQAADVCFDEDIGRDSGMRRAPRLIVRLRYDLPWSTTIRVRYSPNLLKATELAQAFTWAGDFGVGQRRPSSPHGGAYGTFRVAEAGEKKPAK